MGRRRSVWDRCEDRQLDVALSLSGGRPSSPSQRSEAVVFPDGRSASVAVCSVQQFVTVFVVDCTVAIILFPL